VRKVRYAVAQAGEVVPDIGKIVPLGESGGECALFFHNGHWYATGSLCPHQNAPLEGAAAKEGHFVCKRHGYCFDLKTGDCTTLGGYGVPVFDVQVEDETVYVSVWEYD
jgi:nitrite reductase/ring-hydroxylating ferredoxin subunit